MIELLVVVAILAILMVVAMMGWRTQTVKAKDAKRKDDLYRLKVAFEDYYNDNECTQKYFFYHYPSPSLMDEQK